MHPPTHTLSHTCRYANRVCEKSSTCKELKSAIINGKIKMLKSEILRKVERVLVMMLVVNLLLLQILYKCSHNLQR